MDFCVMQLEDVHLEWQQWISAFSFAVQPFFFGQQCDVNGSSLGFLDAYHAKELALCMTWLSSGSGPTLFECYLLSKFHWGAACPCSS